MALPELERLQGAISVLAASSLPATERKAGVRRALELHMLGGLALLPVVGSEAALHSSEDDPIIFAEDVRCAVNGLMGTKAKSAGLALGEVRTLLSKDLFKEVKAGISMRNGKAHPLRQARQLLSKLGTELQAAKESAAPPVAVEQGETSLTGGWQPPPRRRRHPAPQSSSETSSSLDRPLGRSTEGLAETHQIVEGGPFVNGRKIEEKYIPREVFHSAATHQLVEGGPFLDGHLIEDKYTPQEAADQEAIEALTAAALLLAEGPGAVVYSPDRDARAARLRSALAASGSADPGTLGGSAH